METWRIVEYTHMHSLKLEFSGTSVSEIADQGKLDLNNQLISQ